MNSNKSEPINHKNGWVNKQMNKKSESYNGILKHSQSPESDCPLCGESHNMYKVHGGCELCRVMSHTKKRHDTACNFCGMLDHKTNEHPCTLCKMKGQEGTPSLGQEGTPSLGQEGTPSLGHEVDSVDCKGVQFHVKCNFCPSYLHTSEKHNCKICGKEGHDKESKDSNGKPFHIPCKFCGGVHYSHTSENHVCSICKQKGHNRMFHKCEYCTAFDHGTKDHVCEKCGVKGHDSWMHQCKYCDGTHSTCQHRCFKCGEDDHNEEDHECGYCDVYGHRSDEHTCDVCKEDGHQRTPEDHLRCPTCRHEFLLTDATRGLKEIACPSDDCGIINKEYHFKRY